MNWPKGKAFLAGSPTTTSRFSAIARHDLVTIDGEDALRIVPGTQPRHSARERRQGRGGELCRAAAGSARLRAPPRTPGRHQVDIALDRASSRVTSTTSRSSVSTPTAKCVARIASSACSHRRRTAPIRPRFRCCGARPPTSWRAPGSPPGSHAGKALVNILGTIRATNCSRSSEDELLRTAIGDSAPGRPPALPPVRSARPLRALRFVPHLRAARELHHRAAAEVAGDAGPGVSTGAARTSTSHLSESVLARMMITVRTTPGNDPGLRHARAGSSPGGRGAALGGRPERGIDRDARRSAGQ